MNQSSAMITKMCIRDRLIDDPVCVEVYEHRRLGVHRKRRDRLRGLGGRVLRRVRGGNGEGKRRQKHIKRQQQGEKSAFFHKNTPNSRGALAEPGRIVLK